MTLGYRARRRWSLIVLLIGLPLYAFAAVTAVNLFDRPPVLLEFAIYAALGILWILPLRFIFRGVGKADTDAGNRRPERGEDD